MNSAIVVISTTRYQDAWEPFFTLLDRFWPDHPSVVLLSDGGHLAADRVALRLPLGSRRARASDWSELVHQGLKSVDSSTMLFLLEDYFLSQPVDAAFLERLEREFIASDAASLRLRELESVQGATALEGRPGVVRIDSDYTPLVSCQAGFWRVDRFASLLRDGETIWEFEQNASDRARDAGFQVDVLDPRAFGTPATAPFWYPVKTGITQGRWSREAMEIFRTEGLPVVAEKRGVEGDPDSLIDRVLASIRFRARRYRRRIVAVLFHVQRRA